jgi:hypothetical protein
MCPDDQLQSQIDIFTQEYKRDREEKEKEGSQRKKE